MKKEIFNEKFKQVFVPEIVGHNTEGKLKISKLLELITDDFYRQKIEKHFALQDVQDNYVVIGNVDTAYNYVKYITEKFEYLNYYAFSKNVETYMEQNEDNKQNEIYFVIDEPFNEEGEIVNQIIAKAEYDSVNMFYKEVELSKHINYLKKNGYTRPLESLNKAWKTEFLLNGKLNKRRNYRFVKEAGKLYLRSINSELYNEYGVAFAFVVGMLALDRLMRNEKGVNFSITSLSLNESKIDIIVSSNDSVYVEEIQSYISSSISIRNNDLGNKSLSFTNTLKITRQQNTEREIYIFPKVKEDINSKTIIRHSEGIEKVFATIDSINGIMDSSSEFVKTFKGFHKTNSYDELRAKIEEKLITNNSPFKGVKELRDLFKRSAVQSIDNLAKLLDMCGKAEMIDMDFDLKFKLRYLISNVLLYGKNNVE